MYAVLLGLQLNVNFEIVTGVITTANELYLWKGHLPENISVLTCKWNSVKLCTYKIGKDPNCLHSDTKKTREIYFITSRNEGMSIIFC